MRFLFYWLMITLALFVCTILWIAAQIMHYIIPIVLILIVCAFWPQLRGEPPPKSHNQG